MEEKMSDEFASQAAGLALRDLEENLIYSSRAYEDALRAGDPVSAADALKTYASVKRDYDALAGTGQQQQQSGQLSAASRNFLSRRQAGGDELTPQRMQQYVLGHQRAVQGGLKPDSPEYFRAVEWYVDHQGDARQPPLSEREVAKMCGISDHEYAQNAARLQAMKRAGMYREGEG
jgi:hypothetical protein